MGLILDGPKLAALYSRMNRQVFGNALPDVKLRTFSTVPAQHRDGLTVRDGAELRGFYSVNDHDKTIWISSTFALCRPTSEVLRTLCHEGAHVLTIDDSDDPHGEPRRKMMCSVGIEANSGTDGGRILAGSRFAAWLASEEARIDREPHGLKTKGRPKLDSATIARSWEAIQRWD